MRLSALTSQRELQALYNRVSRNEFLRDTPLNLRLFVRYAALFILFPGMVLGFRVGLGVMLAVCVGMIVALVSGEQVVAERLALSWLILGGAVLLWVTGQTMLAAWKRLRLCRQLRPADAPLAPGAELSTCGTPYSLKWRKGERKNCYEAPLVLRGDSVGIWVVMLELEQCGRGHLLAPSGQGICCPHSTGEPDKLRVLAFCKLAPGEHRLTWKFISDRPSPPRAQATIVCKA